MKKSVCMPPLPVCSLRTAAVFTSAVCASFVAAATVSLDIQVIPGGARITATEEVSSYFILRSTTGTPAYAPLAMDMGADGAVWDVTTTGMSREFFTVRQVSAYAPEDSDGDYIDDVYEIQHPVLNPLNAADAALIVPGKTISYLEEYRALFGLGSAPPEVYSREVSSFNFGAPLEAAISREVSAFNFGGFNSVEAISKEVSLFNGEGGPAQGGIPEVYTREVSAFNFGGFNSVEAISKEVSLFNGEGGPAQGGIPELYSREVSTFNSGAPYEAAISREVSVLASAGTGPSYTVLLDTQFPAFAPGSLAGQQSWAQTGTSAASPIQIVEGEARLAPALTAEAQDVSRALSAAVAVPSTGSRRFYVATRFRVDSSPADPSAYFLALDTAANGSGTDVFRLLTRPGTTASTFQLGATLTGTAGYPAAFGGDLPLATSLQIVLEGTLLAGTTNDTVKLFTMSLYADPLSTDFDTLTPYLTATYTTGTATDPSQVAAIILSQFGSPTLAPTPAAAFSSVLVFRRN